MRALRAPELLDLWEQGAAQGLSQRALTLLAVACPDIAPDALAGLSVGERDSRLLTLREWTFGTELAGVAACPGCDQHVDLSFNVSDIRTNPRESHDGEEWVRVAGYECRFRLPTSVDLAALTEDATGATGRRVLLHHCLLEARHDGELVSVGQLPPAVIDAIEERMARADPQADVQLAICCPLCGHQWREVFDIVSFFWREIDAWAQRVLREIHALASAYGWREADILALSPGRRGVYLEMVSG